MLPIILSDIMENKWTKINLPEGTFQVQGTFFDESDDPKIFELFMEWLNLSIKLKSFGGRGINMPEVISESLFCRQYPNTIRLTGDSKGGQFKNSFDVFDISRSKRIQVKACSVLPDLTSFGPNSVWDELYFMTFPGYNSTSLNKEIKIYLIPNDLIYNQKVSKTETMKQQQEAYRRPRFSIYTEIIVKNNMLPVKTITLTL